VISSTRIAQHALLESLGELVSRFRAAGLPDSVLLDSLVAFCEASPLVSHASKNADQGIAVRFVEGITIGYGLPKLKVQRPRSTIAERRGRDLQELKAHLDKGGIVAISYTGVRVEGPKDRVQDIESAFEHARAGGVLSGEDQQVLPDEVKSEIVHPLPLRLVK
jgi:hypothetical protein